MQPEDVRAYGQMEQWLNVESETFTRETAPLVMETLWKTKIKSLGDVDQKLVEEKRKKLESIVAILDAHLAKNQYFAGNQFTLADISYLPFTEYLIRAGHNDILLSKTNFAAWWKRCSERPSWQLCKAEQEYDF